MRTTAVTLALLLVADVARGQFQPLRYDDDFSAQRLACGTDNRVACWKALPIAEGVHLSFSDATIRAWTLATDTGYTFDDAPWQPRLALLLRPRPQIELNFSLDLFWRYSVNDGVYAPDGTIGEKELRCL